MNNSGNPDTRIYPARWSGQRVALAHDWLTGMRGGENVLEIFCDGFPQAPLFTLVHRAQAVSERINAHPIRASWLQLIPSIHKHYRYFLPFFPAAMEHFRVPPVDLVISTSHCVAKGIRAPAGARHVCYCFTPMRYAWLFHDEYFGQNPLKRLLLSAPLAALRRWDRASAARVDAFIAISAHVQKRIERFYGRPSEIVYPPVDTGFYTPDGRPRGHFDLLVSALVPYKRVDLAVRAYTATRQSLKIVGTGGELARLRRMAGPSVEFLEWQPREAIRDLYRACRCLLFPGEEDFGIVPLEAQACGAPVAAYGRGGALETVRDGVSGIFFTSQTEASLLTAVECIAARSWNSEAIRAHAETFSIPSFIAALDRCLFGAPA